MAKDGKEGNVGIFHGDEMQLIKHTLVMEALLIASLLECLPMSST